MRMQKMKEKVSYFSETVDEYGCREACNTQVKDNKSGKSNRYGEKLLKMRGRGM